MLISSILHHIYDPAAGVKVASQLAPRLKTNGTKGTAVPLLRLFLFNDVKALVSTKLWLSSRLSEFVSFYKEMIAVKIL